jgi:hypothetical protein
MLRVIFCSVPRDALAAAAKGADLQHPSMRSSDIALASHPLAEELRPRTKSGSAPHRPEPLRLPAQN